MAESLAAERTDSMTETAQLGPQSVQTIAQRLTNDPTLRLPVSLELESSDKVSDQKRKEYLQTLLQRDPGVFLERYSNKLTEAERAQFEPLRGDYEVDFYLKLAEDDANRAAHKLSATAKNRRHAQLKRLVADGAYFSEDAMRIRAPLLHHQYVGQYTPAAPATAATLSDSAMQQLEEQEHQTRLQKAKAEQAMVEEEEESSSDEEKRAEQPVMKHPPLTPEQHDQGDSYLDLPPAERVQYKEDLLQTMQQRFLSGKDHEYINYHDIDANVALDDDWAAEAEEDAQEKYFDAD